MLLAIDLLFLPWFEVSVGIGTLTLSASSTATGDPDGWLGVIGVLACLALVADLALERLSNAQLPVLGGTTSTTSASDSGRPSCSPWGSSRWPGAWEPERRVN